MKTSCTSWLLKISISMKSWIITMVDGSWGLAKENKTCLNFDRKTIKKKKPSLSLLKWSICQTLVLDEFQALRQSITAVYFLLDHGGPKVLEIQLFTINKNQTAYVKHVLRRSKDPFQTILCFFTFFSLYCAFFGRCTKFSYLQI